MQIEGIESKAFPGSAVRLPPDDYCRVVCTREKSSESCSNATNADHSAVLYDCYSMAFHQHEPNPHPAIKTYLVVYNFIQAAGWTLCFLKAVNAYVTGADYQASFLAGSQYASRQHTHVE